LLASFQVVVAIVPLMFVLQFDVTPLSQVNGLPAVLEPVATPLVSK